MWAPHPGRSFFYRTVYSGLGIGCLLALFTGLRLIHEALCAKQITVREAGLWPSLASSVDSGPLARTFGQVVHAWIADTPFGIEFVLRAPGILFLGVATWCVWLLGRRLYNARTAFWSALLFATQPVVSFLGVLSNGEALATLLWAAALIVFLRALRLEGLRWWVMLGVLLGLGIMTSPVGALTIPCAILYGLVSPEYRKPGRRIGPWIALGVALAVSVPFLILTGGIAFETFGPTPWAAGTFLVYVVAALGPVIALILVWVALHPGRTQYAGTSPLSGDNRRAGDNWRAGYAMRFLLCFSLPVIAALLTLAAFGQRVPFSAASVSSVAAVILTADWLLRAKAGRVLIGLALVLNLGLGVVYLSPDGNSLREMVLRGVYDRDPFVGVSGARDVNVWLDELCRRNPDAPMVFEDDGLRQVLSFYRPGPLPCDGRRNHADIPVNARTLIAFESVSSPLRLRYPAARDLGFFGLEASGRGGWLFLRALGFPPPASR